ncbi:MAG: hypothetical protein RMK74_03140 [Myxococcales bacterium]|nr:hypothetical protein [Myxococcales bacterium]
MTQLERLEALLERVRRNRARPRLVSRPASPGATAPPEGPASSRHPGNQATVGDLVATMAAAPLALEAPEPSRAPSPPAAAAVPTPAPRPAQPAEVTPRLPSRPTKPTPLELAVEHRIPEVVARSPSGAGDVAGAMEPGAQRIPPGVPSDSEADVREQRRVPEAAVLVAVATGAEPARIEAPVEPARAEPEPVRAARPVQTEPVVRLRGRAPRLAPVTFGEWLDRALRLRLR